MSYDKLGRYNLHGCFVQGDLVDGSVALISLTPKIIGSVTIEICSSNFSAMDHQTAPRRDDWKLAMENDV